VISPFSVLKGVMILSLGFSFFIVSGNELFARFFLDEELWPLLDPKLTTRTGETAASKSIN
jgi:hypothetical protein